MTKRQRKSGNSGEPEACGAVEGLDRRPRRRQRDHGDVDLSKDALAGAGVPFEIESAVEEEAGTRGAHRHG